MFALSKTGTPCSGPSVPRSALLVERAGDRLGIGVDLDDGRERRARVVERRDPAQVRLRDLQRGQAARRKLGAQRERVERHDVVVAELRLARNRTSASDDRGRENEPAVRHVGSAAVGEGNDGSGTLPSAPCPSRVSSLTVEAVRRTTTS